MMDFSITFSYIKLFKIGNILPNVLCGIPSLTGKLSAMRIIYGWMENRNAQITVLQNKAMNKHLITNAPDADNYLVLHDISKLQKVGQCFNRKFILNQNSIFGSKLDIYLIDIWMPHLSDKSNTWWWIRVIRRKFHVRLKKKYKLGYKLFKLDFGIKNSKSFGIRKFIKRLVK